jgi:hypothetical protein
MKRVLFWAGMTVAGLLFIGLVVFGVLLARHPT